MFDYIYYLKNIKVFKVSNKSFIGHFNFKNLLIYNDLTLNKSPKNNEKLASYFNNKHDVNNKIKNININNRVYMDQLDFEVDLDKLIVEFK